jgi:hypothetical protein
MYSAAASKFWLDVADQVYKQEGFKPCYWVGSDKRINLPWADCFFHDAWDAFSLQNCQKNIAPHDFSQVLVTNISRLEYYNYVKILDRVDHDGFFAFVERDNLLKRQLSYWSLVIKSNNVECVVFSNAPHLPFDYPLYLCAKYFGLKTVIFNVTSVAGWHYLTNSIYGNPKKLVDEAGLEKLEKFYDDAVPEYKYENHVEPWYMKNQKSMDKKISLAVERTPCISFFYFLALSVKGRLRKPFKYSLKNRKISSLKFYRGLYGSVKLKFWHISRIKVKSEKIKRSNKKDYEKMAVNIDLDAVGDFVYFPLHYQPELTTTPLGGDSSDQLYVIERLSQNLPEGVNLVVKEHPSQFAKVLSGDQGRFSGFWGLANKLENVIICPLDTSSMSLVKRSRAVVTITGTAGWEAIVNNKPCIVFGYAWYGAFPTVIKGCLENPSLSIKKALSMNSYSVFNKEDFTSTFQNCVIKNDIHGLFGQEIESDATQAAMSIIQVINEYEDSGSFNVN